MTPHSSIAIQVLESIVKRRLTEALLVDEGLTTNHTPDSLYKQYCRFLLSLKTDHRIYAIYTLQQWQQIWSVIRSDEVIFDFVMRITHELMYELHPDKFKEEKERLILSMSYARIDDDGASRRDSTYQIMDTDTFERLPTSERLKPIIQNNPWVCVIYWLEKIDFLSKDAPL